MGSYYLMGTEFLLEVIKKILEMDISDDCTIPFSSVQSLSHV